MPRNYSTALSMELLQRTFSVKNENSLFGFARNLGMNIVNNSETLKKIIKAQAEVHPRVFKWERV